MISKLDLVKPLSSYQIMDEMTARSHISSRIDELLNCLINCLNITGQDKIVLLGLGNSISAGWSAVSNNVEPLLAKLNEFILEKAIKRNVIIDPLSYVIIGENSNENIHHFLEKDFSPNDIRNISERVFDEWKKDYQHTPFKNYVDKELFLSYYPESDIKLSAAIENSFTLCHFNGFTGEMLKNILGLVLGTKKITDVQQKELQYFKSIVDLLVGYNENTLVTVGNFPVCTTKPLQRFNKKIEPINSGIQSFCKENPHTLYFADQTLQWFQLHNNKLKIDNHPTIDEQYTVLAKYVDFLIGNTEGAVSKIYN